MRIDYNIHGVAVITKALMVISLGWNIWGVDRADGTYCIIHLWKPRIFRNTVPHSFKG